MSIIHDYSSDGKLIATRNELVTASNLAGYTAEYGNERTLGYRDVLADILEYIATNVLDEVQGKLCYDASPSKTRSALIKFHERQLHFLNNELAEHISNRLTPQ